MEVEPSLRFSIGIKKRKRGTPFVVPRTKQRPFFTLLPFPFLPTIASSYIASLLSFAPSNPSDQEAYIRSFVKPPMFQRDIWNQHTHKELREAIYKGNQIRWKLRKLLHHWRWAKLHPRNEEDIVSGESPNHPVYVVDWNNHQMWVYEASTMMRDITNRLMNHDCFFEDAQRPRNPLTNLPLTYSQKISLWNQLSATPITPSTAFTAYRASKFNLYRFMNEHKTFLLLHALRQSMRVKGDFEVNDRILDFIRYAHDCEAEDYYSMMFTHLLCRLPDNPVMLQWRHLCTRYHEIDILFGQVPDKLIAEREKILTQSIELIAKRDRLVLLWQVDRNLLQQ